MQQLAIVKSEPLTQEQTPALSITKSEALSPEPGAKSGPALRATETTPVLDQLFKGVQRFGSNLKEGVKQGARVATSAVEHKAAHPASSIGTSVATGIATEGAQVGRQLFQAHRHEYDQARAAYERGDHGTAALHTLAMLAPIVGPMVAGWTDMAKEGEYGQIGGDLATLAMPMAAKKLPNIRVPGLRTLNPVEAQAIDWAASAGIPTDAATSTGNAALKAVQAGAERASVSGSYTGAKSSRAVQDSFARVGQEMAQKANGSVSPTSLDQAGESIKAGIQAAVQREATKADTAYQTLRKIEAAAPAEMRAGGRAGANPEPMKLAVDLRPAKTALRDVYETLQREAKLAPMNTSTGRAAVALDRLMHAPDFAPLSVADGALGELKAILRKPAESPDRGSGILSKVVGELDRSVTARATAAGPDALAALTDGRVATVRKYQALDIKKALSKEPVATVRSMLAAKDGGVSKINDLRRFAPETLPDVGRAFLEDLLQHATNEGGFKGGDMLWKRWNDVGPKTKFTLFTLGLKDSPTYVKDLDKFFLAAKRTLSNPNPSGSGYQVASMLHAGGFGAGFVNPAAWVVSGLMEAGGYAASKALRSPRIVKALTNGMTVPGKATAARAASANAIAKAFQAEGLPVPSAFATTEKEKR